MIEQANALFQYLITNRWEYIIWGVIMVSAIIVIKVWGILKNIFDKDDVEDIKNEFLTVQNTLTSATRQEVKSAIANVNHDKELNNL